MLRVSVSRIGQSCHYCFGRGYTELDGKGEFTFCTCLRGQELRAAVSKTESWHFAAGGEKLINHLLSLNDNEDPEKRVFSDAAVEEIRSSPTRCSN